MPGRSRSWFRSRVRVPVVVLAACLAFGAVAACWSVLAPLGEAPDEPAHLGLVLHLADGNPYPAYDGLHSPTAIERLCTTYVAATRACPRKGEPVTLTSTRRHPVGEAPDKSDRPAWDDAGGAKPLGGLDQMPQHPPLYYELMATVLRVERAAHGGPWSTDRELALLRLANVLLVLPLPGLAWWAAKRLGFDHGTAVAASLATFGLPMLTHIGSTLNNDNLLTLCGATLVALLAGVVRGDRRWQTGVAVGVVAGVALLAKAFALVFPPVIVLAYVIGWWSTRVPTDDGPPIGARRSALPLAAAGATTVALSAWWYLGVHARTGKFAPTIEDRRLTTALRPPGFHAHVGPFAAEFARDIDQRFWGSFGWYSVRFSTGFTYLLTAIVVVLVAAALVRGAASAVERVRLAFLLTPMAMLGAFVVQHAWSLHVRTSKFQFIQGRYLLAGATGLAVLVAVGGRALVGRWSTPAIGGAVVLLQGWAVRRCLAGYWGGPGLGPRGQVRAMVAWSAWPGEALGVLGLVLAASVGWMAWLLVKDVREPGAAPEVPVGSVGP